MTSSDSNPHTEYARRKNHRNHASGVPQDPRWEQWNQRRPAEVWEHITNRVRYCGQMDKAWTVMLFRQGLIELETAKKLLTVLADSDRAQSWGGEDWLKEKLGGDEYTASAVNLGRTLQEPMARMQMRETLLDVFDLLHEARKVTMDRAEQFADTMMAGQSHMSHAQPTTYGQYLLTVHDGMARAEEQLALAYRYTNMNSGGCGACSGTGWNVDRQLVTDLLGFDETIDLVYDCEASQDEIPQILFAMSSLALTLNRAVTDHEIWCLEEVGMMASGPAWRGVSSFMPQKAHSGSIMEHIRMACNEVMGQTVTCMFTYKNELIQDNLPVFQAPFIVFKGSGHIQRALGLWISMLPDMIIYPDRMKQIVKEGYSGAPDLAIVLIRDYKYGSRQAHRICATAIRLARERGIKPYDITGALLDEAACVTDDPKPGLTTAQVQDCMSLDTFFEKHNNLGDPHPSETLRMIRERRVQLDQSRAVQETREQKLAEANRKLDEAINEILTSA